MSLCQAILALRTDLSAAAHFSAHRLHIIILTGLSAARSFTDVGYSAQVIDDHVVYTSPFAGRIFTHSSHHGIHHSHESLRTSALTSLRLPEHLWRSQMISMGWSTDPSKVNVDRRPVNISSPVVRLPRILLIHVDFEETIVRPTAEVLESVVRQRSLLPTI